MLVRTLVGVLVCVCFVDAFLNVAEHIKVCMYVYVCRCIGNCLCCVVTAKNLCACA